MTDIDILQNSINQLNNIAIPIAFVESIGVPIARVSQQLNLLLNTILEQIHKEKEEAGDADSKLDLPENGDEQDPS